MQISQSASFPEARTAKIAAFLVYVLALILAVKTASSGEVNAAIIRVSTSGNDSLGDGLITAPYATIQKAIDVATNGDVVEVLAGTYSGTGNRQINLRGKAITVRSADGASRTILDLGRQQGFIATTGEGLSTVVDGFTITNGYVIHGTDWSGKGIVEARNAGITIRNCIFRGNETAVTYLTSTSSIIYKVGDVGSQMLVENCLFYQNVIGSGKWGTVGFARVICQDGAVGLKVSRCTIAHNQLSSNGTAGGMAITTGGAIENTIVWENGPPVPHGIDAPGASYTICDTGIRTGIIPAGLTLNPLFLNAAAGDYSLQAGSPARNAGDPTLPVDRDGSRADIGWYGEFNLAANYPAGLPLVLGVGNATETFSGLISGSSTLTKFGTATVTLTGTNTYTGNTVISGGTLLAGGTQALSANSAVKLADTDGALLKLNGYSSTIGGLVGGGTLGGNVVMGGGTLTLRTAALGAMDIVAMAGGLSHSLLLKSDGSVWACGSNEFGKLGDGTTVNKVTPVQVMNGIIAVATKDNHSLFLKNDGSVWACGKNDLGQLGDGTTLNKSTPVQVMSGVSAVACGSNFSLFLKSDGSVWACGSNSHGQLGDGTTLSKSTPVQVMSGVSAVSCGVVRWSSQFVFKE